MEKAIIDKTVEIGKTALAAVFAAKSNDGQASKKSVKAVSYLLRKNSKESEERYDKIVELEDRLKTLRSEEKKIIAEKAATPTKNYRVFEAKLASKRREIGAVVKELRPLQAKSRADSEKRYILDRTKKALAA